MFNRLCHCKSFLVLLQSSLTPGFPDVGFGVPRNPELEDRQGLFFRRSLFMIYGANNYTSSSPACPTCPTASPTCWLSACWLGSLVFPVADGLILPPGPSALVPTAKQFLQRSTFSSRALPLFQAPHTAARSQRRIHTSRNTVLLGFCMLARGVHLLGCVRWLTLLARTV